MKNYTLVKDDVQSGGVLNVIQNPSWPPAIGKNIVIKNKMFKETFLGTVVQHIWNSTAAVIVLLNNTDYVEPSFKGKSIAGVTNGKGLFLLLPSFAWNYITDEAIDKVKKVYGSLDNIQIEDGRVVNRKSEFVGNIYDTQLKAKGVNMLDNVPHEKTVRDNQCLQNINSDSVNQHIASGDIDLNSLFKDNLEIVHSESNPLSYDAKNALQFKLTSFEAVEIDEKIIPVNENIAINNLIDRKSDELNEGNKIIQWVKDNFLDKVEYNGVSVFSDLKMTINNGYVYFTRDNINPKDKITKELLPNLKFFDWQYNSPIDYSTLKYVLFNNKVQLDSETDSAQRKEAEKIFSQEYLIGIQPHPKYQMWALKRMLIAWYADDTLHSNVRKIKVLINQWRSRNEQPYNKKNGTLPSIVIYPKYGSASAKLVLTKVTYFFSVYKETAWECSQPSWFDKINPLIYFTNGTIDLKMYYNRVKEGYNLTVGNSSFDKDMTYIRDAKPLTEK